VMADGLWKMGFRKFNPFGFSPLGGEN